MFIRSNSLAVQTAKGHYIMTGKKGSPDILVLIKDKVMMTWMKTIALEVKSAKGKQSTDQKEWQDKFEKLGGEYYIVRSVEEVRNIIEGR